MKNFIIKIIIPIILTLLIIFSVTTLADFIRNRKKYHEKSVETGIIVTETVIINETTTIEETVLFIEETTTEDIEPSITEEVVNESDEYYIEDIEIEENEEDIEEYYSSEHEDYLDILDFQDIGRLEWGSWVWTWYSEKVLPGEGLDIPGRWTDHQGRVRDWDGYMCLASDVLDYGEIVDTPFGCLGKVYDEIGSGSEDGIDVYVSW